MHVQKSVTYFYWVNQVFYAPTPRKGKKRFVRACKRSLVVFTRASLWSKIFSRAVVNTEIVKEESTRHCPICLRVVSSDIENFTLIPRLCKHSSTYANEKKIFLYLTCFIRVCVCVWVCLTFYRTDFSKYHGFKFFGACVVLSLILSIYTWILFFQV